jgi:hypothetical protein
MRRTTSVYIATDPEGGSTFGLSVEHLLILLPAALFILGPERLPELARWLAHTETWKRTTTAAESPMPAPDLIGRDFTAQAVNQR